MKTKRTIILASLVVLLSAAFVLSCDNTISLGAMLDLDGPEVFIDSPVQRKAVSSQFIIEGRITDKSDVSRMVIKAEKNKVPYPKQWRYNKGRWEVSIDSGASWSPYADVEINSQTVRAVWSGRSNKASWVIPIDMQIGAELAKDIDGEYLFSVQAWDIGDFSDDKSYKTVVLIIDNNPPSVAISNPTLYHYTKYDKENNVFTDADIQNLHANYGDDIRFDPANIGKFITQDFKLQWEIDDANDIWSIDLRFYKYNETIDENAETFPNDEYIFNYTKNLPPPSGDPNLLPKPNGSVIVPALHGAAGTWPTPDGGSMSLKNPLAKDPVTDQIKTTIKVVAICYDAAGRANEERILGYFIYWKEAGEPWIAFTDGMRKPDTYYGQDPLDIQESIFMIYPGRDVKATAFQAHGVGGVKYSVYKCGDVGTLTAPNKTDPANVIWEDKLITNEPRAGSSSLSTIYPWNFPSPSMTGYYIVEAYAYGSSDLAIDEDNESVLYTALFRVQDIMFPKFEEIAPSASEPLFKEIKDGKIIISGKVTDATRIETIYMAWINPKSRNYAAMSQLQFYRDKDYIGWLEAASIPLGSNDSATASQVYQPTEYLGDPQNRLWNIKPKPSDDTEPGTGRQVFTFSVEIDLESELGIGMSSDLNDLKSQIFLLRAENPDKKCDIITYAPQGDTIAPEIIIDRAVITKNGLPVATCIPSVYSEPVPQFANGDIITIYGHWDEDSVKYLDFNTYLKPNFEFSLNGEVLGEDEAGIEIIRAINYTETKAEGTFEIRITLGENNRINIGYLRDSFMINVKVKDIGGNPAEHAGSWLVASDALSFLRISSENSDDTYKAGDTIEIFLEFSKPVILNPLKSADPVLLLGSGATPITSATATYKAGQTVENTRQYFTYIVGANQTATVPNYLNVVGIQGGDTGYSNTNYRFMWQHSPENGTSEIIRLTTSTTNKTDPFDVALPLPTGVNNIQSLIKAKNISIDTAAPTATFSATQGYHSLGAEVFITATFSENVKIDPDNLPYLNLRTVSANTGASKPTIYSSADEISVTRNIIRYRYVVQALDNTGGTALVINGIGGKISDIAGNDFVGTWPQTLTGVYLDTLTPDHPQIQIVDGSNAQINNNLANGASNTAGGASWDPAVTHASRINLANVYNNTVKIQVTAQNGFNTDYAKLEYSTNNGKDWIPFTNVVTGTTVYRSANLTNGSYTVTARQTDAAGNVSQWTVPISFTVDLGTLISRIDSSTPNGTYSDKTATKDINITVYFRKALTLTATTQSITINARSAAVTSTTSGSASSLSFTYTIANGDNTPAGTDLDVTALALVATDSAGVNVGGYLTVPTDTSLLLRERKDIIVQTGSLIASQANAIAASNDQATGTITFTFNRPISKGSVGDVTVEQSSTEYRLPAVLTEAQSSRYRNAAGFNTYYTRGTNGFNNGTPGSSDTSTKYVLNYIENTVVAPADTTGLAKLAYDFKAAETVTLSITAQDITVSGNTLTINLTGSNALQVLGAQHTITIPQDIVQDNLGYTWPTTPTYTNNFTTPGINKAFIRVDKKVNKDTVTLRTATGGGTAGDGKNPWLTATHPLKTTARLDCRTPSSVVRYIANGTLYSATGTTNPNGGGLQQAGSVNDWCNAGDAAANRFDFGTQYDPENPGGQAAVNYTNFTGTGIAAAGPHISVGAAADGADDTNTVENGFVWRITAKGRDSATGTTYSTDMSNEVALRTVLTVQITSMSDYLGIRPNAGDNLWIRGGDAVSSSSIPGFPLTWKDDFYSLQGESPYTMGTGKRAGIRLLKFDSVTAGDNALYNNSVWKWVSWEINVRTYYEVSLGRENGQVSPNAAMAWQYGPQVRAPSRGGWASQNSLFTMYPGKHRWIRMYAGAFSPGGEMNFSTLFDSRPGLYNATTNPDGVRVTLQQ